MKKRKELLWFLIPFALLPVASVFSTLYAWIAATPPLIGVTDYVGLYIDTLEFWVNVFKAVVLEWVISAVLAGLLGLIVRRLPLSRSMKYVVIFTAATVITAAVWMIGMRLMPQWYNLLNFVKYGNAAAFFAWLAECLWTTVKKPKQESETQ
jgi:hypothetical protein